jgi:hypothetical protein
MEYALLIQNAIFVGGFTGLPVFLAILLTGKPFAKKED